jgi:hypothetical protein
MNASDSKRKDFITLSTAIMTLDLNMVESMISRGTDVNFVPQEKFDRRKQSWVPFLHALVCTMQKEICCPQFKKTTESESRAKRILEILLEAGCDPMATAEPDALEMPTPPNMKKNDQRSRFNYSLQPQKKCTAEEYGLFLFRCWEGIPSFNPPLDMLQHALSVLGKAAWSRTSSRRTSGAPSSWARLLTSGEEADVTLEVNGGSMRAHKCVLINASQAFRSMFNAVCDHAQPAQLSCSIPHRR